MARGGREAVVFADEDVNVGQGEAKSGISTEKVAGRSDGDGSGGLCHAIAGSNGQAEAARAVEEGYGAETATEKNGIGVGEVIGTMGRFEEALELSGDE